MVLYEYLHLTSVYFRTGIYPTLDTVVEIDNCGLNSHNSQNWPGVFSSEGPSGEWGNNKIAIATPQSSPGLFAGFGNKDVEVSVTYGSRYNVRLDKDNFTVDGTQYPLGVSSLGTSNIEFVLGGRNTANGVIRLGDIFAGNIRIYQGGVLVLEWKPTIYNGEYTYYDTVSQTYATKNGSGTIEPGPLATVFEPSQYDFDFGFNGGTQTFTVEADNAWSCTTPHYFTMSTTSGTAGTTTVTITAPTRLSNKSETVTFTDSQSNTFDISISQSVGTITPNLTLYQGATTINKMYYGSELIYRRLRVVPDAEYVCFTAGQANSTIGYVSTLTTPPVIYKSNDGVNWTQWDGTTVTLNNGDKLYLYGDNNTLATGPDNYVNFTMTGSIDASGDITTLLTSNGTTALTSDHTFYRLFKDCSALTQAPDLPATTLSQYCYAHLFYGCTGLTQAPELPSTSLDIGCYDAMFYGCTGISQAPELPATTLASMCYWGMFIGCTGLTQGPDLPATSLVGNCYYRMFEDCTNLASVKSAVMVWNNNDAWDWLYNVALSGTIYVPTGSDISSQPGLVPGGWTVSYY